MILQHPLLHTFFRVLLTILLCVYVYLGVVKIPADIAASFNDLLAHGLGYSVLMVVGVLVYPHARFLVRLFIAFLFFSLLIEIIQYFLPWRSFSWVDMLANVGGLIVGVIAGHGVRLFCGAIDV